MLKCSVQFTQLCLFATPWTAWHEASQSITNCQSLLKLLSIKLVKPSNHLILCRSLLLPPSIFPSIRVFSNESVIRASALASVFPMSIQGRFPLGLTGLISLLSKGLSGVFSSTTIWKHQFLVFRLLYGPTLTSIHDYWETIALTIWTFVGKVMSPLYYFR